MLSSNGVCLPTTTSVYLDWCVRKQMTTSLRHDSQNVGRLVTQVWTDGRTDSWAFVVLQRVICEIGIDCGFTAIVSGVAQHSKVVYLRTVETMTRNRDAAFSPLVLRLSLLLSVGCKFPSLSAITHFPPELITRSVPPVRMGPLAVCCLCLSLLHLLLPLLRIPSPPGSSSSNCNLDGYLFIFCLLCCCIWAVPSPIVCQCFSVRPFLLLHLRLHLPWSFSLVE